MANRIKEFRKKKKWTQGELGSQVGVKASTISNWEAELRAIKIEQAIALCRVLGCTLNDIFMPANMSNVKKRR